MNLHQQGAVVTGGGSGLGAASARALAAKGAKVTIIDIQAEKAQALAADINGQAIIADVTDAQTMEAAFDRAEASFGPIRVCVQCAGIAPAERIVSRKGPMTLDAFRAVIDINLIGTFNGLRLAANHMMANDPTSPDNERGVIINTASVAAFEGQIGQAAYSAAKGGVNAMTLPAAREMAKWGIRVMSIAPGIFATPMMQAMPQAVQDSLGQSVPFPKRLGMPDEYARLVLDIIGNPMLNGSTIRLDGALRMQEK